MSGRKRRRVTENSSNIIKCWFKRAFSNKFPWHFKKDGGILNYLDQESIEKKEVSFFSRIIAENSANDFSFLKILHRVTGLCACKLSVCNFKVDTLKLLQQTIKEAKMVLAF